MVRGGGTAGYVEGDGYCRVGAVADLRVIAEGTAADGTGPDGDRELGGWHGGVRLLQRQAHVRGDGPRDQQSICVTG